MRRGACGLLCWRQSLAGPGHTLAFVSQAFLPHSSRQQRLGRKNFDVAKELESYREEGISEHLFFFFFFPPKLLVINNAFALLWLCSRRGEIISPCLRGWGSSKAAGLGLPLAGPVSFPSLTTTCPYSLSSATQKETKHDICFLHAPSAPSCPSLSQKSGEK